MSTEGLTCGGMKVLGLDKRSDTPTVVTIGAFDGIHLGHRALIDAVRKHAKRLGATSTVVTFDRHPAEVVRPRTAPKLLTDPGQKLELLESTGVDQLLVLPFDVQRAGESAEDFVDEVLR